VLCIFGKVQQEDPSFSEEKEAKRLVSVKVGMVATAQPQTGKVLWFFLSRKNNPSCASVREKYA